MFFLSLIRLFFFKKNSFELCFFKGKHSNMGTFNPLQQCVAVMY